MLNRKLGPVRGAIALVAASGLVLSGASIASADTKTPNPASEVSNASPVVGEAPVVADQSAEVLGNVVVAEGSGSKPSVAITLPVSANASDHVDEGLVVLSDNESSSIVPVKFEDGSVAIHAVINDASAPTTYQYEFDMNAGSTLVVDEESGAVAAVNSEGGADFFVAAPWATDANGNPVPTHSQCPGTRSSSTWSSMSRLRSPWSLTPGRESTW
jgi:hypothetical protein